MYISGIALQIDFLFWASHAIPFERKNRLDKSVDNATLRFLNDRTIRRTQLQLAVRTELALGELHLLSSRSVLRPHADEEKRRKHSRRKISLNE